MKQSSKSRPRIVYYLKRDELRAMKAAAKAAGLRTPHQWARAAAFRALVVKV